jgi:gliding motility-associated-like protein
MLKNAYFYYISTKKIRIVVKKAFLFVLGVISFLQAESQIVASESEGCIGASFTFTYENGSGLTNIAWDFGDGAGAEDLLTVQHSYSEAGTYNVVFTADGVNESVTIVVHENPIANFTGGGAGCIPLDVTFNNTSSGGDGSAIVSENWTFGDGGAGTSGSHTYNAAGVFSVSLTVVDENGCSSYIMQNDIVSTSEPPYAEITASQTIACEPPLEVTFSASQSYSNSPSSTDLTYQWFFDNGNTDSVENPLSQTYDNYGSFNVVLIVADNNACTDTVTQEILINSPVAGFEAPDTVCKEVSFTDTSFGGISVWNYGDDNNYYYTNEHTYNNTGHYIVTQVAVIAGSNCTDTVRHEIYVEEPTAVINVDPSFLCDLYSPDNVIHYSSTNSIGNIDSTFWTFGLDTLNPVFNQGHYFSSLGTSIEANPTDTIIFLDNEYSINSFRVFQTCLRVKTIHGCENDTCVIDTIQKPNALFFTDKNEGCLPLTVTFADSSIAFSDITSYEWVWGDGTSFAGGAGDSVVSHTYTNAGEYHAYLVITCERGCKDTSYMQTIYVGDVTNPDFSLSQTTVCPGDVVSFTDLTTPSDSIDYWHFSGDNGLISHCPSISEPYWAFHSQTGTSDITLTTCFNGCCTDNTIQNAITVQGPICKITNYTMECATPFDFNFTGHIDDANSWDWDFGDGTVLTGLTNLNDTVVNHTYSNTGDYQVILTAHNSANTCTEYSDTIQIYVRDVEAKISIDTSLCVSDNYYFVSDSSIGVYKTLNRGFLWDFGDETPGIRTHLDSISHSFADTGEYIIKLIARDINMCLDTDSVKIRVYGVYPGFIADSLYGCKPGFGVNFADTSICDYGDSIYHRTWNFGDGTNDTLKLIHHDFVYNGNTYYNVTLTAYDSLGCSASVTKRITFSIPDPRFNYFPSNKVCEGDTVGFNPYANDTLIFTWDFGDGDTSYIYDTSNIDFYHVYNNDGIYSVYLHVEDSLGCVEDTVMNFNIDVQSYPVAGFYTSPDVNPLCFGNSATFTDTSISEYTYTRTWTLQGNTPINPDSTVAWFYDQRGIFDLSLVTTTSNGCADTAFGIAKIIGPDANFSTAPEIICKGQDITFAINNMIDVDYYFLDFGDGIISDTVNVAGQTSVNISHTYNYGPETGQTLAQLTIFAEDTLCPVRFDTTIFIHTVIARFNRNNEISKTDTAHCLRIEDFFDASQSIHASQVTWDFGDGNTEGNIINPSHLYTQPGTYNVVLSIYDDESQCVDTLVKPIIIYPDPEVTAYGGDVCLGDTIRLFADGTGVENASFSWSPSSNLDNENVQNPLATPDVTTDFSVVVTDTNDCVDTAYTQVFVMLPPEEWIRDTVIIIGENVNLNGEQSGGYNYIWSPETELTCVDCPNPIATPKEDISYYLEITDTMGCNFVATSKYDITVLPESSVDVPKAFTPNGDGDNDRIYVRGWGIKKLLEFSIYNRWGERVYTSTDINEGWDGTFNGKPQNIDTYAYFVKVETYIDAKPITKKGTFVLLR